MRTSTTWDEGLDIFYVFAPDLVIINVNVGEGDGRAMCRTIKSRAKHEHIPVLLISAEPDNLTDWKKYGVHAAIQKPFQLTALVADILGSFHIKPNALRGTVGFYDQLRHHINAYCQLPLPEEPPCQ